MSDKPKLPDNLEMLDFESGISDIIVVEDMKAKGYVEVVEVKYGAFVADMSGQPGDYAYVIEGDSKQKYILGATNIINVCAELNQFDTNNLPNPLFTTALKRKLATKANRRFYTKLKQARVHWLKKQLEETEQAE